MFAVIFTYATGRQRCLGYYHSRDKAEAAMLRHQQRFPSDADLSITFIE